MRKSTGTPKNILHIKPPTKRCDRLIIGIGQLVTNADSTRYRPELELERTAFRPKTGLALGTLGLLSDAAIAIIDGEVVAVGRSSELQETYHAATVDDAHGALVTPGLIDPHTHPVFAASRANEFEMRVKGATYESIAAQGGGILSSVRKLRDMPEAILRDRTCRVFDRFIQHGTTTIEAKTGYGLDTTNELKMLRVLNDLHASHPLDAAITFLGAHEVPDEFRHNGTKDAQKYLDTVIHEMMPEIAPLAEYCDVFCERGVFTAEQAEAVLRAGLQHGLRPRIHTDEFADIGGTRVAKDVGCVTADHLHVTTAEGIEHLVAGNVIPVLLPGVPFFLGQRDTAPARAMIGAGLPVALATDYNPGSAYIISQVFTMSLACLHLGLTPAEALTACTVNAAWAIDRGDELGRLLPGFDADFVIWDIEDYRELPYSVAQNPARRVYKRGRLAHEADATLHAESLETDA